MGCYVRPHLDIADLWVVVHRPDLRDDRQRLEVRGQTEAAAAARDLDTGAQLEQTQKPTSGGGSCHDHG